MLNYWCAECRTCVTCKRLIEEGEDYTHLKGSRWWAQPHEHFWIAHTACLRKLIEEEEIG